MPPQDNPAKNFLIWQLLRRRCTTVWLRARPEDHWNRVIRQGDHRPMAKSPHAMQELKALLAARERLYGSADLTVETSKLDEVAVEARLYALLDRERAHG